MKLTHIHTGFFKLDGGAMFGVVPKTLWSRMIMPDANNLCTWALNCLLVESGDRRILIDCGIGDKQSAKWRSFFEPHGDFSLVGSLAEAGVGVSDITDVLLTHLHFDHCGGALRLDESGGVVPVFPNAVYWSNERHWRWALEPNARERASFLKENFEPLMQAGVLQFIDFGKEGEEVEWLPDLRLRLVHGHTEAMMVPIIGTAAGTLVYCADLMPSAHHVGLPYVMAYDVRPLVTIAERERLLLDAVQGNWWLMFEHDADTLVARATADELGRIKVGERLSTLPG